MQLKKKIQNKINPLRGVILMILLLLSTNNSYAAIVNTAVANTVEQNTMITNTAVGNPSNWDLTSEEWSHYEQLMQGSDGHWYPQLTPPEVLGLNAQTAQEQQHYAEIVAKEQHDKLARELAFDNAVHQATLRLYSDEPIVRAFNLSPFNPVHPSRRKTVVTLETNDHLALFVDPMKGLDFATLPRLIAEVKNNSGIVLDIYCVGNVDDNAIRDWAKLNNIPMNLVTQGRITLNHDNGKLEKTAGVVIPPYVLLVRNGESTPVSIWNLT